jgi:hypothetical protein
MTLPFLVFGGFKTNTYFNERKLHEVHLRNVKKYLPLYIYISQLEVGSVEGEES